MADTPLAPVVRYIHQLVGRPQVADPTDADLLRQFVHQRDEDAFAALVRRHGPLVWRVCRRLLRHTHHAEEAYQATFLVLARQAAKVRKPASLASFFYGVAYRIARKARADIVRRQSHEKDSIVLPVVDPACEAAWRELEGIVVEEVHALAEKYRLPILLCYWQGLTNEEAAVRLGWPAGTVKTRLLKVRRLLHERLTQRGVSLSAGVFATLLAAGSGEAAVPADLASSALRMGMAFLRGDSLPSAGATALAEQAVRGVALSKVHIVLVLLLASGIAAAVGAFAHPKAPARQAEEARAARPNPQAKEAEKPKIRTDRYGDPLPPGAVARLGSLRLYHGQPVRRVTLSPDGQWVVSTSSDGNRLWDAITGRERPLRAELRQAAVFSTRDKLVAVAKHNLDLQFWDLATGKKIGALLPAAKVGQLWATIHLFWLGEHCFSPIALSPDGRTLVVSNFGAGGRPVLRFCDVVRSHVEEPIVLKLKNVLQTRMAFSADSKTLVLQCNDATVHIWDVARRTEKLASRPSVNDYGGQIALSPDGKVVATAPFAGKRVRLWDTSTLKERPSLLKQPNKLLRSIMFSPDGKQLVSANANSPTLHLWDLATRKEIRQFRGMDSQVFHPVFSADGKYLAAGIGHGVTFWDVASGKFRHDFGHTYTIDSIHFSPDGRRVVTGAGYTDNLVRVWDPLTGEQTGLLRGHASGIQVVEYAPDGKWIASASQDGSVRLWDAATGRQVRRLEAKDGMVYAMAFAPDGKTIASGGSGKAVHLSDVTTGRKLRSIGIPGGFLMNLAFSPDGKMLATQDRDEKDIRLWDVAKGEQLRRLAGQPTCSPNLAFSPNGQTLAAGSDDGVVRLWDVKSAEECRTFAIPLQPGEVNRIYSVAFSPDGRTLAVGHYGAGDESVRLWELCSGQVRIRYEGHRGGISSVAFSPDGTLLASGGTDRIITVWDVMGQRTAARPTSIPLAILWRDLGDTDAGKAYRAVQMLLGHGGQDVSFLKERLHPTAILDDEKHIPGLLADLDSDSFAVRQKATEQLRRLGERAEPALRQALRAKLTLEARKRVQELLAEVRVSPAGLRELRAVEVLEHLGTTDAQQVLESLAKGASAAPLTHEAKRSLERLAKRRTVKP